MPNPAHHLHHPKWLSPLSPVPHLNPKPRAAAPKATSHVPILAHRVADVLNKPKAISVLKPTANVMKAIAAAESNPVRKPMANAAKASHVVANSAHRSPKASAATATAAPTKPSHVLKAMLSSTIVVIKLADQRRRTMALVITPVAPAHKTTALVIKPAVQARRTAVPATKLADPAPRTMISVPA